MDEQLAAMKRASASGETKEKRSELSPKAPPYIIIKKLTYKSNYLN